MVERRVIDRATLINALNNMPYQHISELQMHHLFLKLGQYIQIEDGTEAEEET